MASVAAPACRGCAAGVRRAPAKSWPGRGPRCHPHSPAPCHTPCDRWNDGGHVTDRKEELRNLPKVAQLGCPLCDALGPGLRWPPSPLEQALLPPWLGVLGVAGAVQPHSAGHSPPSIPSGLSPHLWTTGEGAPATAATAQACFRCPWPAGHRAPPGAGSWLRATHLGPGGTCQPEDPVLSVAA